MVETRLKKTRTVICCLPDRELAAWSARCFLAAGLNAIVCCTLKDLDGYAAAVQADAVLLDGELAEPEQLADLFRRCALAGLVTCVVASAAGGATAGMPAWDDQAAPDIVFQKPMNCDGMALELSAVLRRAGVPQDLRKLPLPARSAGVYLHTRWCQLLAYQADNPPAVLELSAQEYRLMHALLSEHGRLWAREDLLAVLVRGGADLQQPRSVDQAIRRLRDKLGGLGLDHALVTQRGAGYRWSLAPEA